MNVTYACHQCEHTTRAEFDRRSNVLSCVHCGHQTAIPNDARTDNPFQRCVVCPSKELYVRKDFPQGLGVSIVVLGFAASCIPWYYHNWFMTFAILFSTALIDVVLYALVGNLLQCYRCHAQYRGVEGIDEYQPFDLEVHERHRQQLARLTESEAVARNESASAGSDNPYAPPMVGEGKDS